MEQKYLDQLPAKSASLLKEIEEHSGREVHVLPNPYPVGLTDPNPTGMACMVDESGARIFLRNESLDAHSFTHELLHIHRYWVRQIPQVVPVSDPNGTNIRVTSSIENAIEHLIIVPEEEQYGFEPYAHWNFTCRLNWEQLDPSTMSKFALRKNCLLGWLTVSNLVSDVEVVSKAEKVIGKQGFLQKAKEMNLKVCKYSSSKEKQISCIVEFLRIPRTEVKLVYFDPRSGHRIEKAVDKYKD